MESMRKEKRKKYPCNNRESYSTEEQFSAGIFSHVCRTEREKNSFQLNRFPGQLRRREIALSKSFPSIPKKIKIFARYQSEFGEEVKIGKIR